MLLIKLIIHFFLVHGHIDFYDIIINFFMLYTVVLLSRNEIHKKIVQL